MPDKSTAGFELDLNKVFTDLKLPRINLDDVLAAQRKNIEALTAANRIALEGIQAVARRQTEAFREMMEGVSSMAGELLSGSAPEAKMAKEADLAKAAFERTLVNMRELAEMMAKSNTEAADVINRRTKDSLDEIKALAAQAGGGERAKQG